MNRLKDELKAKLKEPSANTNVIPTSEEDSSTSRHFSTPFWKLFYEMECDLNNDLADIEYTQITHVYNPIVYAFDLHCAYLRKFLNGPKKLMLVGMNPGPNGMVQNGIPFGNIQTVTHLMGLKGQVKQPPLLHPKRPVTGLACTKEEPSGVKIWTLINEIAGSLDVFSQQCYMHNFCPLAFFDKDGKNITPSELKGVAKTKIRDRCLKCLEKEIQLVQPEIIVAVGSYVDDCIKRLAKQPIGSKIRFLKLAHPSPRSKNNHNWSDKARQFFEEENLMKYLQNKN